MDFYQILGVAKNATETEIHKAYRKLAMQYHPDRNPGDKEAEEKFKQIQEAYETLHDPVRKSRYDGGHRTTHKAPSGGRNATSGPFNNIWDVFTGGGTPNAQVERGRNIQVNVDIELKDVFSGVSRNITIPKRERCIKCNAQGYAEHKPCNKCHGSGKTAIKQSPFNIWMGCGDCNGTGRSGTISCSDCKGQGFTTTANIDISVTIPQGVDTGHQLRLAGYGEPSKKPDGKNGDLNLIIIVKEHKLFKRNGVNLTYEFPVGYSDLCLGATVEIPTITGSAMVTIPPNTSDYTQFRLKGMGLPYFNGGKGDLIVIVKLTMPSPDAVNSNKELLQSISQFEKNYLAKERERFKPKGE